MQYAPFDVASVGGGDATLIAEVSGQDITVYGIVLVASVASTVKLKDSSGPTDLTGAMSLIAGGQLLAIKQDGTNAILPLVAGGLVLNLSALGHVAGWIMYLQA